MPEIARGDQTETVEIVHELGNTTTNECSPDVKAGGIGVVREDDQVEQHSPHTGTQPKLTTFSGTVKVNGKGVGRKDDQYSCDAKIKTGLSTVIVGD